MKKIIVLGIVMILGFSSTTVFALQKQITNNGSGKIQNGIGPLLIGGDDIMPILLEQLDETMLLGYMEDLVDISKSRYLSRFTGTEGCKEAKNYIVQEFENMGLDVKLQSWTARGTYFPYNLITFNSENIEATLHGDPESDSVYIISAHYDTIINTPSADDNSAGVAAVLCAAKIMSQYEFNHEVRFICWSGEEEGLLGSHAYVKEAYDGSDNIIAAINLDMIGYQSEDIVNDENMVRVYEICSEGLTDVVIDLSENPDYASYINLEVISSDDDSGHVSDQRSFCEFGYNSLFIHEYTWNEKKDTFGDTIENMDVTYATKVAKIAMATIVEFARSPIIPNTRPEKPETPDGPDTGNPNVEHTYSTSTTDADGDMIYYLFDWGDGTHSGWLGPYNSDEVVEASHTWDKLGYFGVKVKAKDVHGIQSDWSDPLPVSIPVNQNIQINSQQSSIPYYNPLFYI